MTFPPPSKPALPWSACPRAELRQVLGVLTDIDDTLTTGGAITADALDALARLRAAGLHVVAITGRPLGWSRPFASAWPVDAIVAENGAVGLFKRPGGLPPTEEYAQDEATRTTNAVRLKAAADRVLREVPGSRMARDSAGRVTDIAIDHGEFAHLDEARIQQALALLRAEGLTATVSSIHINAWFGTHSKLSGARWAVSRLWGRDLDAELTRWVFVGDSTNDELLFGHFPLSVGVANVMRFEEQLRSWPRYVTRAERGAGFAEVVDAVLGARA